MLRGAELSGAIEEEEQVNGTEFACSTLFSTLILCIWKLRYAELLTLFWPDPAFSLFYLLISFFCLVMNGYTQFSTFPCNSFS